MIIILKLLLLLFYSFCLKGYHYHEKINFFENKNLVIIIERFFKDKGGCLRKKKTLGPLLITDIHSSVHVLTFSHK